MVEYTMRRLPNGTTIKYRKNPPIDPVSGKAVPTKKQVKARKAAGARFRAAHSIVKASGLNAPPGTKRYGNAMRQILTKNLNETTGKLKSRITRERSKVCRKNGKIAKCPKSTPTPRQ